MGLGELLDGIQVPLGPATYAEPFDPQSFLKMPANALVNLGYLVVALAWLLEIRGWRRSDPRFGARTQFASFALMGAAYAPIQFWRIVTQSHLAGVFDQWTTLPFFAYLGVWNLGRRPHGEVWRARLSAMLAASVLSYGAALLWRNGFVAVLAAHIAFAVLTSLDALRLDQGASIGPFCMALVCCVGFVVLKEADLPLGHYDLFQRLTGHFWSKVCDVLQIHFALRFVSAGYLARARSAVAAGLPLAEAAT